MFYRVGNVHRILPDTAVPTEDLPSGFYDLRFSSMAGFSIDKAKPFPLPSKTYGDVVERADRCITTFFDRAKQGRNTGMMLKGEKGSGKSLLAKITAAKFVQDHGGVVLNIDQPFEGSGFIEVLNNIHRPTIVLCDEFEKVYKTLKDGNENEHSAQEGLLSIMDGGTVHNKLFIFTVNDVHKVNEFLKNRPGRIYYDYEYSGLNDTFIEQFLNDHISRKHSISL